MSRRATTSNRLERRLIAVAVFFLGVFNLAVAMLPRSVGRLAELNDVTPSDAIRGSHFGLVVLGLLFILTARGLWHGKHTAWLVALFAATLSVGLHLVRNVGVPGMLISAILIGALLGTRSLFPARMDPPTVRRGVVVLLTGVVVAFLYSTIGLYFLDAEFRHQITLSLALRDSFSLLFVVPATESEPVTRHGVWFVDSARIAFLTAFGLGLIQILSPVVYRVRTTLRERYRVELILEKYADSALAFFALLPDKAYFFSAIGNAFLAYRVSSNTAVVMGDPIGRLDEFGELIDSFMEYCDLNGWACGLTQSRPNLLPLYQSHGLKALKTGEEAIVDLPAFSLSGTAMKHFRATMNRFHKENFKAVLYSPPHGQQFLASLREVSDAWLAQGGRRERTFTLGYFDERQLQQCDIMVAEAPDGHPVAFANVIPCYKAELGTFDMLRYRQEPKAVADFLCISLIEHFRELGLQGMSLGLAPFSGIEREQGNSPAAVAMRIIYRYGGFLLRYQGLRAFKAKFQPAWEPRYLIYSSETQLPGLAVATMQVGELKPSHPDSGVVALKKLESGSAAT